MRAVCLACLVSVPAAAGAEEHAHAAAAPPAADMAAFARLAEATAALDPFQDVAEAERAGYVKPGRNDGFQMGEHWYRQDLLREPVCRLEAPQFLQYLVIDGRRTLIGTGYVCHAAAGPPDRVRRGGLAHARPELCRTRKGAFLDASYWAAAQDVCDRFGSKPEEREIVMLHTLNWIAAPDGPFAHENRAIPFLRAGLRVPVRESLDSAAERAVAERFLASLRVHEHGAM